MIGTLWIASLCLAASVFGFNKEEFCKDLDVCTKDLIPHCMKNGSVVKGCDGLKKAVCQENKEENLQWDPKYVCRDVGFCNSNACTYDLIPHCLNNGTIVRGCGDLKRAECEGNKKEVSGWEPDMNCLPEGYCEDEVCTADNIEHCLSDGTTVYGCWDLRQALCGNRKLKEITDWVPGSDCNPQ